MTVSHVFIRAENCLICVLSDEYFADIAVAYQQEIRELYNACCRELSRWHRI